MPFTHLDNEGNAKMVDVSHKDITDRSATATATVLVGKKVFAIISAKTAAKGDVLTVAKIAGIQAAKKTAELIPLCHPLMVHAIDIHCELKKRSASIVVTATARTRAETGVEMEALTAASVCALTVYDMCKAVNKSIKITEIYLVQKSGGKSGPYMVRRRKA